MRPIDTYLGFMCWICKSRICYGVDVIKVAIVSKYDILKKAWLMIIHLIDHWVNESKFYGVESDYD